jgi:hypothetical protein
VIECSLSIHEALGLIPNTGKKKKELIQPILFILGLSFSDHGIREFVMLYKNLFSYFGINNWPRWLSTPLLE